MGLLDEARARAWAIVKYKVMVRDRDGVVARVGGKQRTYRQLVDGLLLVGMGVEARSILHAEAG